MSMDKERVAFEMRAPDAETVFLSGTFNAWSTDADPMKMNKQGVWKKTKLLAPGRYEYKFIVDGVWQVDPACRDSVCNRYGTANSVLDVCPGSEMAARRDAYIQKMKARLDKWNQEIDRLEDKASQATGTARSRYRQQIETLHTRRREFEERLEDARETVEQAWEELKDGLEKGWTALQQGIRSAKGKFK